MIGVILAAGKGSRISELNYPSKTLLKINGKTIIEHNIEYLISAKITDITIVVGHNKESIMNYIGSTYKSYPIKYVYQEKQMGIVDAIKQVRDNLGESTDDFIMLLGDELFTSLDLKTMIDCFYKFSATALVGVVKENNSNNISKSYTIDFDESNNIRYMVEKPKYCFNLYKGTGCCIFNKHMLDIIDNVRYNYERSQYEMVDWILSAKTNLKNAVIKIFELSGSEININTVDDYREAEKIFKED